MGSVSRNRPPVFTPASVSDAEGFVLARDLAATDPEGEAVTYDATPLPPGATLSGNQLRWTPDPAQAGTYFIRVRAADRSGGVASAVIKVVILPGTDAAPISGGPSGGSAGDALPVRFELMSSGPNPAHGIGRVVCALPRDAVVHLDVLDAQGRLVRTLQSGRMSAGYRLLSWNGRRDSGAAVEPGVYFLRMRAGGFAGQRRIVMLR